MSSENFTNVSFPELLTNIVDNRGKTCPTESTGIALIATNCIKNDNLYPVYENVRYVSDDTYKNWFRGHPIPGDFIFVTKGTPGRVCLVPQKVDFCIAQDMVAIRADSKKIDQRYLFAVLRSPDIQGEIENLHVGSLIPHFKKGDFGKLLIPLPGKKLQEYIGEQYFALSMKIDLLHRQNKTLEGMAEALWRKMFVEEASPKWQQIKMSDIIEVRDGTHDSPKQTSVGFPLITSRHLKEEGIDFLNAYKISEQDYFQINKRSKVDKDDLLFSMIGTLGLIHYVDEEPVFAIKNIGLFKSSQKPEFAKFLYLLLKSPIGKDFVYENADGSTQEYISLGNLRSFTFYYPGDKILHDFNKLIEPYFCKLFQNKIQIRKLSKLRDTLLPKLFSGEVKVKS
jgi:type I restriction enzyme S subunit